MVCTECKPKAQTNPAQEKKGAKLPKHCDLKIYYNNLWNEKGVSIRLGYSKRISRLNEPLGTKSKGNLPSIILA